MTDPLLEQIEGFRKEAQQASKPRQVAVTQRRLLETVFVQLQAADAAIHAAMMAVGDTLEQQHRADRAEDPMEGCLHLDAVPVDTFGDGPRKVLCPNCGEVDAPR